METFRLLYIALGPGIAIAVYIYYSDKWEPEPKSLVIKSFLLGGLAFFPTAYFEDTFLLVFGLSEIGKGNWWQTVFYAFFGVALAEELCKFLFLKGFIYDDRQFSEPFDGIVYGGMIGCGFATVENLFYVFEHGPAIGIMRMITAVPSHAFDGMILGYFVGRAKFSPHPAKHFIRGLALVILLHGIYDVAAFSRAWWSFIVIFGIVFLGIFLGLKAKKILEQHSEVVEFSQKEFFLIKDKKKQTPLALKDIRELLSEGKLTLDDSLIVKKSGQAKSIKEIFSPKIISQYKGLAKSPPGGPSVKLFLVFYGLTFGFYLYFWFLRNYRDFRNYKKVKLSPEVRALGLLICSIIPYFLYGMILYALDLESFEPVVGITLNLLVAAGESTFLWFQLKMIKRYLKRAMKGSFNPYIIIFVFFILSNVRKLLTPEISFFWVYEISMILMQGGILALVQRDLNLYWKTDLNHPATDT